MCLLMVLKHITIILDGIKSLLIHIYDSENMGYILYRIRRHRLIVHINSEKLKYEFFFHLYGA